MKKSKFYSFLSKLYEAFKYMVAPPVCYACHVYLHERVPLCQDCDDQLHPVAPKTFQVSKSYVMSVYAVSKYVNPLKKMILAKHHSNELMMYGLADIIWMKTVALDLNIDCIVPIPLHWTRQVKRGFNQAELIAQQLAKKLNVPMLKIVKRVKRTQYQARLEQKARKENVRHAFIMSCVDTDLQGKHVMLVDDLCTTGSTLVEIAKLLTRYKPASIQSVVACRAQ